MCVGLSGCLLLRQLLRQLLRSYEMSGCLYSRWRSRWCYYRQHGCQTAERSLQKPESRVLRFLTSRMCKVVEHWKINVSRVPLGFRSIVSHTTGCFSAHLETFPDVVLFLIVIVATKTGCLNPTRTQSQRSVQHIGCQTLC